MNSDEDGGHEGRAADDDPETYSEWLETRRRYRDEVAERAESARDQIRFEDHVTVADGGTLNIYMGDSHDPDPGNGSIEEIANYFRKLLENDGSGTFFLLCLIAYLYTHLGAWGAILLVVMVTVAMV